jgi:hypothetical protein
MAQATAPLFDSTKDNVEADPTFPRGRLLSLGE